MGDSRWGLLCAPGEPALMGRPTIRTCGLSSAVVQRARHGWPCLDEFSFSNLLDFPTQSEEEQSVPTPPPRAAEDHPNYPTPTCDARKRGKDSIFGLPTSSCAFLTNGHDFRPSNGMFLSKLPHLGLNPAALLQACTT